MTELSTPPPLTPDQDLLQIIGSPLRLFLHLGPKLWPDADLRIDPWLLKSEVLLMDALYDKKRRFVGINAPPQISKSTLVEVFTPLWRIGHWPDRRCGCIAYNDDLAQDSGALVRDLIDEFGMELFGLEIDPNENSKKSWRVAGHRGGMISVGITSTITGKPMDDIFIGDVIKDMEEAASKSVKDKHWAQMHGAIRARQANTYVMAHTRFADDDLTGRIKARQAEPTYEGERWEFLSFPAIAEPSIDEEDGDDPEWRDVLGRRRGEPLACRFSEPGDEEEENWEQSNYYILQRSTDPYEWSCIYQQEPTSPTGSMFDRDKWGWYDPEDPDGIPPIAAQRRVWDLASKKGAGDWSVGQLIAKTYDGDYLILDVWRDRQDGADMKETLEFIANHVDGPTVPILIEEERSGSGKTLVSVYDRALPNHTVEGRKPDGEKHVRAKPASMLQQRGRILLPRTQIGTDVNGKPIYKKPDWVQVYIEELRKLMPDGRCGRHDDQIDTLAYGINDMLDTSFTQIHVPNRRFFGEAGATVDMTDAHQPA